MSWEQRFYDPIILPGRKPLVTLRDAALFITTLPKVAALLLVAEHDGDVCANGVMKALNRHVERVFDPSRKDRHWGRRKLARDR